MSVTFFAAYAVLFSIIINEYAGIFERLQKATMNSE